MIYNVIGILGLNCGKLTLEFLLQNNIININSIFCKSPRQANEIAGYIDLKSDFKNCKNIFYYTDIKDIERKLKNKNKVDLILAIGISEILSAYILNKSKLGVIGAHAAKLPERPGCSPIIWAILDKLKYTEMTLFKMTKKIDKGPIYSSKKIRIDNTTNSTALRLKMDFALKDLLENNLVNILKNKNKGFLRKGKRNYTRKRNIRDGQLFFNDSAEDILLKIRALNDPYPGAHFYAGDGNPIIIEKARLGDKKLNYLGSGKNTSKNILCIVAHPDDEALGIGGTLIKHNYYGDKVFIVILSEGESAKSNSNQKNPERYSNAQEWSNFTNCNLYKMLKFPDQRLDQVPLLKIVKSIEKAVNEIRPHIIYTHHPGDINSDHQIAAQVTLAATRPISYHNVKPEIRTFETPSSTDQGPNIEPFLFKPNFYISLEKEIFKKKIEALQFYKNELKPYPHPRSKEAITALAKKRGSESGFKLAEAVTILRKHWN